MKVIFFAAVLLFCSSYAKPHSAKRSPTCSDFPKQLSGRVFMTEVSDSGSSTTTDARFNIDINLQRIRCDITTQGQSYTLYVDHKSHKNYLVYSGGCLSVDQLPMFDIQHALQLLKPVDSGKLGLNGASVDLYSLEMDGTSAIVTLEGGLDKCIPVNLALRQNDTSSTLSYLDMKTTVDPEKMEIPEECMNNDMETRSSPQAILNAVKRGFPWIQAKKRGFPWIEAVKRGFPWIEAEKRGFPWVEG